MSLGILRPTFSVAILACDPQPPADPPPQGAPLHPARPPSSHPTRPTSTRTSAEKVILKRAPSTLTSSTPRVAQPSTPPCPEAAFGAPTAPTPTAAGSPTPTVPTSALMEKLGAPTRSVSTRPKSVTMSVKINPITAPDTNDRATLSPRDVPASPDRRGSRLGPIPTDAGAPAAACVDHYGLVTRPGDPGHFRMVQLVRSARFRDQLGAGGATAGGNPPTTTDLPEPAIPGTLARRQSRARPWSGIAVPAPTTASAARLGGAAKADAAPADDPASAHLTLATTRILVAPVMPQTRAAARRITHGDDVGPHSVLKTNMAESELLGTQKVGERKAQALLENVIGLWAKSKSRRKPPGGSPATPNTDQPSNGAPGAAAAIPHADTKRALRGAPLPHVGAGRLGARGGKGTTAAASASALNSIQARSRILQDSPGGRKGHRVSIATFPTHPERDPCAASQGLDHGRTAIRRTSRSTTPSTPALAEWPASDQALKNTRMKSARPGRSSALPFSAGKETKPISPPVSSTKPGQLWRNGKPDSVQNSSIETLGTSSSGSSSSLENARAGPSTPSPRASRTAGGSRTSSTSISPAKRGQPDSSASRTASSPSRLTPIVTLSNRLIESPTMSSMTSTASASARPGSGIPDTPSPSPGTGPSTPRPLSGASRLVAAAATTPIGSRPPSSSTTRPRRRRSARTGRTTEPTTAGEYLLLPSRAIHQIGRVSYYSHRRRRRVKYLLTDLATPRARARRRAVADLARRVPTIPLVTLERALLPPDDVLKPTATRKLVSTIYDRIMSAKRKGKDANSFMDPFLNPFCVLGRPGARPDRPRMRPRWGVHGGMPRIRCMRE
ncbi:hypothetical protein AMAG_17868 [Allomyces macrogynus ATCC 38327]|uniref:Uncharacterized protein n=1 Tax=Allomyces macrogynus (strain ATCC 38327) TaxID=578462 RepID=A0A0L0S127_ALLM3|nr:hypothetical protein AMAG_17868 [Allomyces macrogynus ATCC 38327]|eukprot:KNE56105.1 hypothetical protein AMAG_17868 [Allomyces macrogynus ATCC 38327]